MGGGVGVSAHAPIRIATNNTVYAMPETGIGFFTDVGGSYFLPWLHDNISSGLYLGITGFWLKGPEVLQWGVATHFVDHSRIKELYEELIKKTNKSSTLSDIWKIVDSCADNSHASHPISNLKEINYCFQCDSIHKIVEWLEEVKGGKVTGLS